MGSRCRSGWAAIAVVVACVLAPASASASPSASSVYVALAPAGVVLPVGGSNPISVAPEHPSTLAIAIAPDGETAYVDDPGAGTLIPVDLATDTAGAPIPVGSPESAQEGSGAIAITPDGTRAYVLASGGLTPVDLATRTVLSPIAVPTDATGLAIAPDGRTAYVTDPGEGTVTPVDLNTGAAQTPMPAGPSPGAIAITPDGATAYVADRGGAAGAGLVTPIDLATGMPETAITTGGTTLTAAAISPDGTRAYVADADGHVIPIDLRTRTAGAPITPVPGPFAPPPGPGTTPWAPDNGITFSPDGQTVYAIENCLGDPHCLNGMVFGISVATGQVTSEPPFGAAGAPEHPMALAAVPGPTAALSVTAAPAGQPSSMTATASNPGGSVTGYAWSFGDGTTSTTPGPTASHVYAQPGHYTVTLSTTNQGGCATALEFTGQTASCTGRRTVQATQAIDVPGHPAAARPRVTIHTTHARVVHGRVKIGLACRGGAAGAHCRGTLSLTSRSRIVRRIHRHRRVTRRTVVLARAHYALRSGHARPVTLRLTARGERLLAHARDHHRNVRATATVHGGHTAHRTVRLRLNPPHRHRRHKRGH